MPFFPALTMISRLGGLPTIPKRAMSRFAISMVRIGSVPLLVVALTGWIPAQYDLKMAWPWSAIAGFSSIATAVIGLFRPVMQTLCAEVEKSRTEE